MRRVNALSRLLATPAGTGVLLAALGLTVWTGLSVWAGLAQSELGFRLREAWDTSAYFYVGLPVMVAAVAFAAFVQPRRAWRWAVWLVAGHQLGMLVAGLGMQSELSLLLLTLMLAIMLAAFLLIPALIASRAARLVAGRVVS